MPSPSRDGTVESPLRLPGGDSCILVLPGGGRDPVVEQYRAGQQVNDHLVHCLRTVLPGPGVVVDLGCHVGTFSVAAAAIGHRVVAVDASVLHVELVTRSAEVNGLTGRLKVIHAAVSDRPGTVEFRDQGLFGAVNPDGSGSDADACSVEAATVPALLARAGLTVDDVDLIKMDLEGSELRAVAGMAGQLAGGSGPMLLYESNPLTAARFHYSIDGLRTALGTLGYTSYRIEADGLFACPPTEPQPEAWVDLLALTDRHVRHRELPVHGPWADARLLGRFDFWSKVPHGDCRAYLATTLLSQWGRFAGQPLAEEILARLVRDDGPDVRQAVDRFRWEGSGADQGAVAAGRGLPAAPMPALRGGIGGMAERLAAAGQRLPAPVARLLRPAFHRLAARWRNGA